MKPLKPEDFVPMDLYVEQFPIEIQLAYAEARPPNIFGKIYHDDARLWLYKNLADIVLKAADFLNHKHGYRLLLYDGLRTVEAQQKITESRIAQANPQWYEGPDRLLSHPGSGAHPRGMAIDCALLDEEGNLPDMGTVFDYLAEKTDAAHNPAHRHYPHITKEAAKNRTVLDEAMMQAAKQCGTELDLLDSEWWDFRLPKVFYGRYAPLSESDLPLAMRMVT